MRIVLFLFALIMSSQLFGQSLEKHHRVRIDLTNTAISEVSILGLETDHGQVALGQHLVNDFSESEIELLRQAGIPFRVEIADVTTYYKEQAAAHLHHADEARVNHCGSTTGVQYDYDTPENYEDGTMGGYFTYEEFLQNLDDMAAKYPNLISAKAQVGDILTHEDRPIYWLRISDNPNMDETEPEILYTALHHAREANSLSQLLFYMWYVLENYETDPEIKFLVDNSELYFIPMVNPDGYVYNETNEPQGGGLWRKNKWRDSDNNIKGVDLNRNYGFEWAYDDQGSSPNPDAPTYRGTAGFSEPETQAIKLFCEQHEFLISLNYHTYGNLLIHPWGYEDGPTAEDETFKTLGRAMNSENDFKLGTGVETVGYTVNGDSDDWMYGETDTKNAIYSLTPEVGPGSFGFWPPSNAIDELNKSTVRLNLNACLLLHNLLFVTDESPELFVGADQKLDLKLKHAGLASGSNTVTVTSNDAIILSIGAPYISNLQHLQEEDIEVSFTVDPNITAPQEVTFTISVDNGTSVSSQDIVKVISPLEPTIVYSDPIDSDMDFNIIGEWGVTDEDFISAPTSFTDSPNDNYENNRSDFVLYNKPFDLSEAILANLKFSAKWDIEADYDFVRVMVGTSPNINNMTAMCGLYTNPGVPDQIQGEPLYDGVQAEWVQESIDLHDFLGEEEVYVAFSIVSDGFVNGDGFYFDNLEIEQISDIDSDNKDLALNHDLVLLPNPTNDIFQVKLGNGFQDKKDLNYQIVDIAGKLISTGSLNPARTLTLGDHSAGTYQVIILEGDKKLAVRKIVKIEN